MFLSPRQKNFLSFVFAVVVGVVLLLTVEKGQIQAALNKGTEVYHDLKSDPDMSAFVAGTAGGDYVSVTQTDESKIDLQKVPIGQREEFARYKPVFDEIDRRVAKNVTTVVMYPTSKDVRLVVQNRAYHDLEVDKYQLLDKKFKSGAVAEILADVKNIPLF